MKKGCDGVSSKLRAVESRWRKISQRRGKRFGSDRPSFCRCAASKLFCQERRACDSCGATTAEEAGLSDSTRFEVRKELQDVPANWIRNFNGCRGPGKFAGVARIAKVIENGFAEHFLKYRKGT